MEQKIIKFVPTLTTSNEVIGWKIAITFTQDGEFARVDERVSYDEPQKHINFFEESEIEIAKNLLIRDSEIEDKGKAQLRNKLAKQGKNIDF